ncbi:uncharacterized protein LOC125033890 [Penaeus chinensis]|uniref:uncharacterized protein LOC125033890 n=1 Tax=Penaeus chinensis TaxID=139456 RepID=UPI001FB71A2F|nr:uncharacterized protein LOC125033890 [Penaeus chinensis]
MLVTVGHAEAKWRSALQVIIRCNHTSKTVSITTTTHSDFVSPKWLPSGRRGFRPESGKAVDGIFICNYMLPGLVMFIHGFADARRHDTLPHVPPRLIGAAPSLNKPRDTWGV